MLYFIPAWYQQNQWYENEQNWYMRRTHSEFDDTVKQMQLFHRSKAYPYQLILLSCAPNFRHFLHRQSVYHAPYWSCFDAIQEVRRKQVMTLSFHNLNWPADIEFEYTPFVAVALLHGEKYAQIEFGEDGNPIQVDMYANGRIVRRNNYDDRGFVSNTIVYEEGTPLYQDYLTEKGIWKIRYYFEDGHVEVNPQAPRYLLLYQEKEQPVRFCRLNYECLEQVIGEVLAAYIKLTERQDIFCVAMHERHAMLLKDVLKRKKTILSFFEDRYEIEKHPEAMPMIGAADYIIADSWENVRKIQRKSKVKNIMDITPFDSRVDLGISQQLNVQKILIPVDGMQEDTFVQLIQSLGGYLLQNENAQIHLFTRQAEYGRKSQLLAQTRTCLRDAGLEEDWAIEAQNKTVAENQMLDSENVPIRFFVDQCVDELSVSKCMREQRLIVDMRKNVVELYLRIAAISVGIPQIVYTRTQFVVQEKNGFVLQDMNRLAEAIDYYLGNLTNWNEAMVYSYELGKKYTTKVLIEKWKEVLEGVR